MHVCSGPVQWAFQREGSIEKTRIGIRMSGCCCCLVKGKGLCSKAWFARGKGEGGRQEQRTGLSDRRLQAEKESMEWAGIDVALARIEGCVQSLNFQGKGEDKKKGQGWVIEDCKIEIGENNHHHLHPPG